jgi:hypothetical protein
MMQLSALSRTTSISYSFQPISDSSISSLVGRREVDAALADLLELLRVVGDAAAGAAEREAGPDHHREAVPPISAVMRFCTVPGLFHRVRDAALGRAEPDLRHRVLELQAVLGLLDRVLVGADHLDAVLRRARRACAGRARSSSAVCPPIVGRIASGRSLAMIFSTTCQVIGSM